MGSMSWTWCCATTSPPLSIPWGSTTPTQSSTISRRRTSALSRSWDWLAKLGEVLASGGDPAEDEVLAKHAPWAAELRERYTFTAENVDGILRDEVGKVFAKVLEHAGVFKRDEAGRAAFLRFTASVQ